MLARVQVVGGAVGRRLAAPILLHGHSSSHAFGGRRQLYSSASSNSNSSSKTGGEPEAPAQDFRAGAPTAARVRSLFRDLHRWAEAVPADKLQRLGYADLAAAKRGIRGSFRSGKDWLHDEEVQLHLGKGYEMLGFVRAALVPRHRWPNRPFRFASEGHVHQVSGDKDQHGAIVGAAMRIRYNSEGERVAQAPGIGSRSTPHTSIEKGLDPAHIRRHYDIIDRMNFQGKYWKNGSYVGPHRQV